MLRHGNTTKHRGPGTSADNPCSNRDVRETALALPSTVSDTPQRDAAHPGDPEAGYEREEPGETVRDGLVSRWFPEGLARDVLRWPAMRQNSALWVVSGVLIEVVPSAAAHSIRKWNATAKEQGRQ